MSPRSKLCVGIVSALLLAAATLKFLGMEEAAPTGPLLSLRLQLALGCWEAVLGCWLLATIVRRADAGERLLAWCAACVTFLAFAGVSLSSFVEGEAECGCFGPVKVKPIYALIADIVALSLLAWNRCREASWKDAARVLLRRSVLKLGACSAGVAGLFLLAGWFHYGPFAAAIADLRQENIDVPGEVDLGAHKPGSLVSQLIPVCNRSGQTVRLIGGTVDCTCLAIDGMPITLEPGEQKAIRIQLLVPKGGHGRLSRQVVVWTDLDSQRAVGVQLVCHVE